MPENRRNASRSPGAEGDELREGGGNVWGGQKERGLSAEELCQVESVSRLVTLRGKGQSWLRPEES